ncbi:hypothetical protein [Moraxella lacunata]|uniref:hypothetical protein n=1 Tax=Moraxella lacunata TaxID=477 RepID=UPI003EE3C996
MAMSQSSCRLVCLTALPKSSVGKALCFLRSLVSCLRCSGRPQSTALQDVRWGGGRW